VTTSHKTLPCIPITEDTVDGAIAAMQNAAQFADVFELRIDFLKQIELSRLLAAKTRPVIVTNRPTRQGGHWNKSEQERISHLREAIQLGADYVDIEDDSVARLGPKGSSGLIISNHDLSGTPSDLKPLYQEIVGMGADIVKIVTTANTILDTIPVFDLLDSAKMPTIGLAMGEPGVITRILASRHDAFLTFGSLEKGKESAAGQITARDLLETYRIHDITKGTALYGVIANPVAHSLSPSIHNAAFKELDIDARYLPLLVHNVQEFLEEFNDFGFGGFSVTLPHKQSVMPCLDEIDPLAEKIGAVNTVVYRKGRSLGSNTDCTAAVKSLEKAIVPEKLDGNVCLIVGAGGVARAVAFGLKEKNCRLIIANRTYERGVALAEDVGAKAVRLDEIPSVEADVIVNATSVGMYPKVDHSPVPKAALKDGVVVFDTIYNPQVTLMLRQAKASGCRAVTGLDMFVSQAAEQFQIWTQQSAPSDVMKSVLVNTLTKASS